jgi:transposase InsO family protein
VRFGFVDEHRKIWPVRVMCEVLGLSARSSASARLPDSSITPSMSRKGDCCDNAPMESFFQTLKTERVHHRVYATRAEARRDLFAYVEGFYNYRRLHSAIGWRRIGSRGSSA